MVDKDWIFVLGAQDPEMREIERMLRRAGRPYIHAARNGQRCVPRTAYEANGVVRMSRSGQPMPAVLLPRAPAVFVECSLPGHPAALRVDHHNPGDPGYDKRAEAYLQGSSLGQVLQLLEMEPDTTQRLLAAADHCLTAAYRGECPGVDPGELLFQRAAWQAKMSGRSLGDVVDGILGAARQVERNFDSEFGEALFLDPTEIPPDLAEGAAYAGRPVRYRQLLPTHDLKEMLKGAEPEHIERFMAEHQQAGREVYGNPYRGYAGAYL
ncbi:hypothetical protein dqs_1923 [Azoarcus olearius]|uniref:TetR family transcriptional regulator n=1 Tax=Azoarcus sp. (strain BH72) TaxID=418699 RepID=UPI0008061165|nr:TetR family transcriptional regulator [Azoarcus olearius]ANQ84961.1 hypothetical protein dqs_1923 [Azoarcus olearius]